MTLNDILAPNASIKVVPDPSPRRSRRESGRAERDDNSRLTSDGTFPCRGPGTHTGLFAGHVRMQSAPPSPRAG